MMQEGFWGRRAIAMAMAAVAAAVFAVGHAQAQTWPSKPIRLIVPFPPGGSTDTLARQLGNQLGAALNQSVVVENIGGANGSIGMGQLVKAKPDGYTLGLGSSGSQVINPLLYTKLAYSPATDLSPISMVAEYVNVLVVNESLPVHNVAELIRYAKANPDKVSYGSAGNGSSNHLGGFNFARSAGIQAMHVPYKGSAPALVDLMGGNLTFMFDVMATSMPQVRAGKLRALATSGTARSAQAPELATVAESLPGFSSVGWFALFAPAHLPDDITRRLNAAVATIVRSPEMTDVLSKQGFDPVSSTPEQLRQRMASESSALAPLIKASGAKVD
jgi:tripartite-type tricarboxylate transporter receptor subunit TctC